MAAQAIGYWYLATPYTLYPGGLGLAFVKACEQEALLLKAGVSALSPIAHSHPVATWGGINPTDHAFWMQVCAPFMEMAKGLIVCRLPSWERSAGIAAEIETFKKAGKPVVYMDPGTVPEEVR